MKKEKSWIKKRRIVHLVLHNFVTADDDATLLGRKHSANSRSSAIHSDELTGLDRQHRMEKAEVSEKLQEKKVDKNQLTSVTAAQELKKTSALNPSPIKAAYPPIWTRKTQKRRQGKEEEEEEEEEEKKERKKERKKNPKQNKEQRIPTNGVQTSQPLTWPLPIG